MTQIKKALISVSDKTHLAQFAQSLVAFGIEIISTGGTYDFLTSHNVPVTRVSEVTNFPEILDGRVKTLHPMIHGAILAKRDDEIHQQELTAHNISQIDLVVVNLYPFEKAIQSTSTTFDDAIKQIDIGGPALLRSAAKNHEYVSVICDPTDYDRIIDEMRKNDGYVSDETRLELAVKVFQRTSAYDSVISDFLDNNQERKNCFPDYIAFSGHKSSTLRYGENPHQLAALYGDFGNYFEKIHGKELSYNNIVDIQAASEMIAEFDEPGAVIIKHTNPCGCALGESVFNAYNKALSTDPVSAFGGIVAVNRTVDTDLAEQLNTIFLEVIIAPEFSENALVRLRTKKDRRLIIQKKSLQKGMMDIKPVAGGYLVQSKDELNESPDVWKVVTNRAATEQEQRALSFAWKIAKHLKSNAIVYTNENQTLGIGAGQMSRIDSSTIAVLKSKAAGLSLHGSVVASDAFFPFADGLLEAVRAGATAAIQPGGSIRDAEVIQAANEHNIAMVFTGIRHFKH